MNIGSGDLDYFRQQGDNAADVLISLMFEKHGHQLGSILMPILSDFDKTDFPEKESELLEFFNQNQYLPNFYSLKEAVRANDFYKMHQASIGVVLGCYSLPYCYLGEDGARVLGFSERIKNDTYRRLLETGNFVKKIMQLNVWEENKATVIILKVRLMHAFWRFMILKSGKWDMKWGMPINQEDMLGTNLSFSLVVLRGLRKMGFAIDKTYEKAYFNHWAVIGSKMGIDEKLLVFDLKDALKLEKWIANRQFKPSEVGKELTKALEKAYVQAAGNELAGEFFRSQARILMGSEYADWLGIEKSKYPDAILIAFNRTSSFLSNIYV